MQVHAARQAILNRKKQTVAYELLFREGIENVFPKGVDSETATSKLVLNQHLNIGFKNLTQGKRALINYGEEGILQRMPSLLPVDDVVIEILEEAKPTKAMYEACQDLHQQGYRLALDDFQYHHGWNHFLPFAKLIKFDIQATPLKELAPVLKQMHKYGHLRFLAEKVETYEEFEEAMAMGFEFFQGYFFCKPEMFSHRDIESNYHVVMAIYSEMSRPQLNFERLTLSFEKDVSLTYKLLRFINSSAFNLDSPVGSIKQALVYLGEEQARKFITLVATAHLGKGKPIELVRISIIRARFCESIIKLVDKSIAEEAFLLGLFSLVDAILDKPIEDIIEALPLTVEIKEALLGLRNPLYQLLQLVKAYETGSWYNTQKLANVVNVKYDQLGSLYEAAVSWSDSYEKATQETGT